MAEHPSSNPKTGVALLSVLSNSTLVILKLAVGLVAGSVSIISEAIHSGIDLVAAIIAYFAVRTSGKPADREHPFGHGKFENISGAVEALLIFVAAIWIIIESVEKILHPKPLELAGLGMAVMLISAAANTLVARQLFKVGKATESVALIADAWHLKTDVYTSLGVMAGLGIIWVGGFIFPGTDLTIIDPIAAMFVALLIIKAAWTLTADSVKDLLDTRLAGEEEELIRNHIRSATPLVRGFHGLKTRKAGGCRFVEFHLILDPEVSVKESHDISHNLELLIREHFSESNINIHMEPCDGKCDQDCREGCLVPSKQHAPPAAATTAAPPAG